MTKTVTLGEICEYARTGKTPSTSETKYFGDEINWYTPGDFTSKELSISKRGLTNLAVVDKKATIFDAGSVLITCIGEIGKVGIIREKASSNQQITAIKPKADVLSDFLYYFLIKNKSKLKDSANNAVVPIINSTKLKETAFSYPPLPEQRRIAALLDRADALRQKDRQLLAHYDKLAQSIFLDLFGDPVQNEKGWEVTEIATLMRMGKIITYGIVQAGPDVEDGVPYIKTGDIKEDQILINQLARTSKEIAQNYERSKIRTGDIVMSIRATVGTVAITPSEIDGANLTQGTARISPDPQKANNIYLFYHIKNKHSQDWIQRQVKGATFKEITLQKLREMPVMAPPLSLQTHFAMLMEKIERQKAMVRQQMAASEGLFGRLLQESFGG